MKTETKTCCVTGHRDIPVEKQGFVEEALRREVAAAIEDGYTRFISGFAAGVDLMFASVAKIAIPAPSARSFSTTLPEF